MDLNWSHGLDDIAPGEIIIRAYRDIDGTLPASEHIFRIHHLDPRVIAPLDLKTSTRIPKLLRSDIIKEYDLEYSKDSVLKIQGDFDLPGNYFESIVPSLEGNTYFNTFNTDSIFIFGSDRNRIFYSVIHYQNILTIDNQNRITSMTKESTSPSQQAVKYDFIYKD